MFVMAWISSCSITTFEEGSASWTDSPSQSDHLVLCWSKGWPAKGVGCTQAFIIADTYLAVRVEIKICLTVKKNVFKNIRIDIAVGSD
jgi:hypothetical protein